MVWLLTTIETRLGSWSCRVNDVLIDAHPTFDDAVAHLRALGASRSPAQVSALWDDGRTAVLGSISASGGFLPWSPGDDADDDPGDPWGG